MRHHTAKCVSLASGELDPSTMTNNTNIQTSFWSITLRHPPRNENRSEERANLRRTRCELRHICDPWIDCEMKGITETIMDLVHIVPLDTDRISTSATSRIANYQFVPFCNNWDTILEREWQTYWSDKLSVTTDIVGWRWLGIVLW